MLKQNMMLYRRFRNRFLKYRSCVVLVLSMLFISSFLFSSPMKRDFAKDVTCLSDQDCFPTHTCKDLVFTGHDWYFCNETINFQECIVYSVGISLEWSFDSFMSKAGCEVHSFDPTVDLSKINMGENIHFHPWGLGSFTSASYGNQLEGSEMLSMEEIIQRLGHENKKISILKMDCEGINFKNNIDVVILRM